MVETWQNSGIVIIPGGFLDFVHQQYYCTLQFLVHSSKIYNIAMEHLPFVDVFPIGKGGFPAIAMLVYWKVQPKKPGSLTITWRPSDPALCSRSVLPTHDSTKLLRFPAWRILITFSYHRRPGFGGDSWCECTTCHAFHIYVKNI